MCTTILVGKGATIDESHIIARTEDGKPDLSKVLLIHENIHNQSNQYKTNLNKFTYQVPSLRYRYTSFSDWNPKVDNLDDMRWGSNGFNEKGVGMSSTETIFAKDEFLRFDPYLKETGVTEDGIFDVVLPYINTAKEGVIRLGEIIESIGAGEGFGVAFIDNKEIWYLETGTAHQWLANRLPNNKYYATGNQGRLEDFDPNDQDNFLASSTVISFAKEYGFYDEKRDGKFNFRKVYTSNVEVDAYYNYPRVWVIQNLYNKKLTSAIKDGYDFSTFFTPDKKLSIDDIKDAFRNHYDEYNENPYTSFYPNLSKRPVDIFRTQQSHIMQIRSNLPISIGSLQYISFGMPSISVYIPVYYGANKYLPEYSRGSNGIADNDSAHWKFRKLQTLIMQDYAKYAKVAQESYADLEKKYTKEQLKLEEQYLKIYLDDNKKAQELLDNFQIKVMQEALDLTDDLANIIFTKLVQDVNNRYLFKGA